MNRVIYLFILACFTGINAYSQASLHFAPAKTLPGQVNSEYEEIAPVYDALNHRLYFTRTGHPQNLGPELGTQDIWCSDFGVNGWGAPTNQLVHLNTKLNNSAAGYDADNGIIFLLGTYEDKLELQQGFSYARLNNEGWSKPEKIKIPGLKIKSNTYGGIITGDVFLISMNSTKSLGEEDLYVSLFRKGKWTEPQWLGDSINSAGFEISPFMMSDDKTLLFASNGHGGFGGCDIFYSIRKDSTWNNWTRPKNLGEEVNSENFEAYPFLKNGDLYFASNKYGGKCDLYIAKRAFNKPPVVKIVFKSYNTLLSDYSVELVDVESQKTSHFESGSSQSIDIDGVDPYREYRLMPKSEYVDLSLFRPYLVNDSLKLVDEPAKGNDGFYVINSFGDAYDKAGQEQDLPKYPEGTKGVYLVNQIPAKNLWLALIDENGNDLQYAKTNESGQFEFANIHGNDKCFIKAISGLDFIKQAGKIYYTDKDGKKLFAASIVEAGIFNYTNLSLESMEMLARLSEIEDTKLKSSVGVFQFNNLPAQGVKLYLIDENNQIIEEVFTDGSGMFEFKKLSSDKSYRIRVADESLLDPNSEATIYFMDKDRKIVQSKFIDSYFSHDYESLTPVNLAGLGKLKELDFSSDKLLNRSIVLGLFHYHSLPVQGIILSLIDEHDRVVETTKTDANGYFTFNNVNPNRSYIIRVSNFNGEIKQTQIFFLNESYEFTPAWILNKDSYSFSKLSPDFLLSMQDLVEIDHSFVLSALFSEKSGVFNYKGLPRGGVTLILLDESDNIVGEAVTDPFGVFSFKKLRPDTKYAIRLGINDLSLIDEASLWFDNAQFSLNNLNSNSFIFTSLLADRVKLQAISSKNDTGLDISKISKTSASGTKNEMMLSSIFFNFNSIRLSDRDRVRLNREVYRKIRKNNQPILIVGYSCDLGEQIEREEVAAMRAREIKKYLISMGVASNLIETAEIANSLDGVPNPTDSQREDARRAEIYFLAP